jgi:MFS family permease
VTSGPDQGRPADSPARPERIFGRTYRTLTFGVVAIITVIAFEFMGVVTAMPIAARDLGGLSWYAWAFTAFSVTSLYSMVVGGEWADRYGPVRPIIVGASLFGLGLLIAGTAEAMPQFLLGRAVQGLGSGGTLVAMYVVIGKGYPEELRPRVFTALSGAWVVPGILGPVIAGWITDNIGWRWVFLGVLLLMVPIGAVLVPRLLRLHLPGDPTHVPIPGRKRLALLAALGTGLLQLAGQQHDRWSLLVLAAAVGLLAISVPRLLPAGTVRLARGLPMVVAARGLFSGAFNGAEAFVPLMLVTQRGLSTSHAGATISGAAVGWFIGSWVQTRPTSTLARIRLTTVGGWLVAAGIALTALVVLPSVPPALGVLTWGFGAFGMGILFGSLAVLLLQYSTPAEQGINSASIQVADSLGVITFTGISGAIFASAQTSGGATSATFVTIFLTMAVVVAFAAAMLPRLRRPGVDASVPGPVSGVEHR